MKKILTTILAGTLVAGSAFAADAKITLNYRSRLNAFSFGSTDNDGDKSSRRDWMSWDNGTAYNGAGSDTFKFVLKGERAGATFAVNLADVSSDGKALTGSNGLFTLNEYSGWMNFPIGPGTLTLTTGNWKDGYADGNYRVKKDVDAQNAEGVDFERFKLGSILKGSRTLVFVDDLAAPANNKATSGFADYGLNVTDDISLNVLVGGVSTNEFDAYTDGDTAVTWNSALVSRIQFGMKDVVNAELIYKLTHAKSDSVANTFALYVMPKILDGLTLNVGGAVELYGGKDDYTDWGVDLRLRYQVMDPLSITFFTNVSGTSLDSGRQINSGNVGYDGKQGYTQRKFNDSNLKFKVAMWNNLTGRFKVNDLLTATLNLGLITPLSKVDGDKNSYSPEWRVTPAVQIYAASNASLWAGVAISGASVEDWSTFCVDIPVIFRVKM